MVFTFNTYTYNGTTMNGTLSVPVCELFETGKDYYTLKITATCGSGTDTWEYRVVSTNGYLPSIILGGQAEASTPWGGLFYGTRGTLSATISSASNWNTRYYTATQYSHTGSNIFGSQRLPGNDLLGGGNITSGDIHVTIEADFPIFMGVPTRIGTNPDNIKYRPAQDDNLATYTGQISNNNNLTNIDKAINYFNVINSIPENKVWSVRCLLKKNGAVVSGSNKAYDFRIQPDARIWFVLTNRINGDDSANMILHISKSPWLQKIAYAPDDTYAETSSLDSEYWFGNWQDYDTGDAYTGVCSTNIPIFESDEKGDAYGRGEIGTDEAINGGDTSYSRSTIGDDLSSSDIPTVNLSASGVGCYTYAVSETQLKEIMGNYLFTTDANLQQSIKDALWTWGNNPIDFMIDCYYVPFSISAFYDTINANLKFGTYQFPNTSYPAVKESNGNRLTLFNTTFEGVYGDWRDYTQFTYDLYLPFVGFFTLDNYKYLNHTVKCEMMFDLSTHNVRYYLFVDGVITDRVDGSVGVNIPLMATDTVNKAKHDRDTKYGLVTDALSVAGTVGELAAGDISGVSSGINKVVGGIKKYEELKTKPSSSVEGSFSSSMNIYDISYAYLRITEKQLILPDKLNQLYNYPSYYMGSASQLSGYCEISDIRINGFTGTVDEMEQLKRDLMEGVIL